MLNELNKAVDALENRDAGWVTRRDAAELLGKAAARGVDALRAHREESDVDVRAGVERALSRVIDSLRGTELGAGARTYSLGELAKGCVKEGERTVTPQGRGFDIHIELAEGRAQTVHIEEKKRSDGAKLVQIYSRCGKVKPDAAEWALRNNMNLAHCAMALTEEDGETMLVLLNCLLFDEATPDSVKTSVKEIAFYGDWIEKKFTGLDAF